MDNASVFAERLVPGLPIAWDVLVMAASQSDADLRAAYVAILGRAAEQAGLCLYCEPVPRELRGEPDCEPVYALVSRDGGEILPIRERLHRDLARYALPAADERTRRLAVRESYEVD